MTDSRPILTHKLHLSVAGGEFLAAGTGAFQVLGLGRVPSTKERERVTCCYLHVHVLGEYMNMQHSTLDSHRVGSARPSTGSQVDLLRGETAVVLQINLCVADVTWFRQGDTWKPGRGKKGDIFYQNVYVMLNIY